MEDILKTGIITSAHGVRGEVKVFPTTDDVRRFKRLKEVLLEGEEGFTTLRLESVKLFKQFAIVKFEGLDSRDDVERLRGRGLYVTRENAVKLEKDEYYIADLIGMEVTDEEGKRLGVLKDVMDNKANDVYIIELSDGRELLLPAIKQCILDVDVEGMKMKVHVLEGLL
ncbi:MAG TPA: 16S rRNA processing protein RimM [Lachnospiraceae bacterium]|nr:16S rRNA processing protein RimM [Lachnospiraceae bacterium]